MADAQQKGKAAINTEQKAIINRSKLQVVNEKKK